MAKSKLVLRKQVAALPVRRDADGALRVMLVTSRETHRFIVPKGWPMKRRKDHRAAAIEAMQEAGVIGRVHRKPIGHYVYWKRLSDRFDLCKVKVFVLEVETQLPMWREKDQRRTAWLTIDDAADLIDDVGLVGIIRGLPKALGRHKGGQAKRRKSAETAAAAGERAAVGTADQTASAQAQRRSAK